MTAGKSAGKALVESITGALAAIGLEPDAKELELLGIAEGLTDQLEGLQKAVAAEGHTVTISSGRVIINPAVAAITHTSLALNKVLEGVSMTEGAAVNLKKQAAAQARWRSHNEAKAARRRAGAS